MYETGTRDEVSPTEVSQICTQFATYIVPANAFVCHRTELTGTGGFYLSTSLPDAELTAPPSWQYETIPLQPHNTLIVVYVTAGATTALHHCSSESHKILSGEHRLETRRSINEICFPEREHLSIALTRAPEAHK
ncbi:hypothetical protein CBL_06117 [Carabus blaptoides fortunei]